MTRNRQIITGVTGVLGLLAVVLMTGCGKDETAGGTIGAASGALLGAAVSGRHSKGEGALVGGVLGHCLGRAIGASSDQNRERKEHKKEVTELKAENRSLQHQLTKWCINCNRQVRMRSAKSCPDCGSTLIQEKFCDRCNNVFSPECGYRYCPYCNVRVELKGR